MKRRLFYRIIIGDSRNLSQYVRPGSVHMILTSPPYWGVIRYTDRSTDNSYGDLSRIRSRREFFKQLERVWRECYKVLSSGGVMVVNFQDMATGAKIYGYARDVFLAGDYVSSIENAGFYLLSRWIWKKYDSRTFAPGFKGKVDKYAPYLYGNIVKGIVPPRAVANWEYVFAFGKGRVSRPNPDFTREEWIEWSDGVWEIRPRPLPPDINDYIKGVDSELGRAAVMELKLAERLIKIYSKPFWTVLDPFCGTGTTCVAAFNLSRSCICVEVRPELEQVIKRRLRWGARSVDPRIEYVWEVINTYASG